MIADVDRNGSGAIDFDEFVHMMTAKIGERDTNEELMKAFQIIDQDNNVSTCVFCIFGIDGGVSCSCFDSSFTWIQGKISVQDINRISKDLGELLSQKEIQDMIEEADRDCKLFLNLYIV